MAGNDEDGENTRHRPKNARGELADHTLLDKRSYPEDQQQQTHEQGRKALLAHPILPRYRSGGHGISISPRGMPSRPPPWKRTDVRAVFSWPAAELRRERPPRASPPPSASSLTVRPRRPRIARGQRALVRPTLAFAPTRRSVPGGLSGVAEEAGRARTWPDPAAPAEMALIVPSMKRPPVSSDTGLGGVPLLPLSCVRGLRRCGDGPTAPARFGHPSIRALRWRARLAGACGESRGGGAIYATALGLRPGTIARSPTRRTCERP